MKIADISKTSSSGSLDTREGHLLFWRQFGNPDGKPIVLLHGGPGSGMDEYLHEYFDLQKSKLIMFDQRGSGASLPRGSLNQNTTSPLIEDCARIVRFFSAGPATIVGGSWGARLAVEFAKKYPELCSHIFLYSAFLGRPSDEQWFMEGARRFFPDYWQKFTEGFSGAEKKNIAESYRQKFDAANPQEEAKWAAQFISYMSRLLFLEPAVDAATTQVSAKDISAIKIFLHYSVNNYFLSKDGILQNIDKIAHIPGHIIHGRYDMDSPLQGAFELANAWRAAQLHIVPGCGHSDRETPMKQYLTQVFHDFATAA